MPSMEELIMGLYGTLGAPGAEDELRRGARGGRGGYEGIGGDLVAPGMFAAFGGGQGGPGFSGAMGRDFQQGSGGLAQLLQQVLSHGGQGLNDFQGPAFRNFANQGFDFNPPGQDQRNAVGGPNIAPGNLDNAEALNQPMGPGHVPGVPQGVAVGTQPGRVSPMPQTQGWRNVHPGYSAAAQAGYGTPAWGGYEGQPSRVAPGAIGEGGPGAAETGGGPGRQPGAGGGQEQGPQNLSQTGGGGGARLGGGFGGTTGGGGGNVNKGGGGQGGGQPVGQPTGQPGGTSAAGAGARQAADRGAAINISKGAGGKKLGGSPILDALGAIQSSAKEERQRIKAAPSAKNFGNRAQGGTDPVKEGKLAGLSKAEKADRKAVWEAKVAARQEKARVAAAPSANQFGANSATNDRGSGLKPLPKPDKGKTRPKGSSAQQR